MASKFVSPWCPGQSPARQGGILAVLVKTRGPIDQTQKCPLFSIWPEAGMAPPRTARYPSSDCHGNDPSTKPTLSPPRSRPLGSCVPPQRGLFHTVHSCRRLPRQMAGLPREIGWTYPRAAAASDSADSASKHPERRNPIQMQLGYQHTPPGLVLPPQAGGYRVSLEGAFEGNCWLPDLGTTYCGPQNCILEVETIKDQSNRLVTSKSREEAGSLSEPSPLVPWSAGAGSWSPSPPKASRPQTANGKGSLGLTPLRELFSQLCPASLILHTEELWASFSLPVLSRDP